jgi:hypothetical protein
MGRRRGEPWEYLSLDVEEGNEWRGKGTKKEGVRNRKELRRKDEGSGWRRRNQSRLEVLCKMLLFIAYIEHH